MDGPTKQGTATKVLLALSVSHLLNDTIQSLLPSIYPMLKDSFQLSFAQIGFITLAYQSTASLLQPVVGVYTDRKPKPYSLVIGMGFTLVGIVTVAFAPSFYALLFAAALVGAGSSVFHPEASRVAHMAAGHRRGFAQALFQVGGNFGTSLGPLMAAWFIVPHGQTSIAWFGVLALAGIFILERVGRWYSANMARTHVHAARASSAPVLPRRKTALVVVVLLTLVFSKYFYLVSLTSYYTFYLIHRFGVSVQASQLYLFLFLFAVAAGTILGGPLGDRFGRKYVIWLSILGVAPFTLILPHVGLMATALLSVVIGVILASAFSAILVYAQELLPGNVGLVSGMFFGFAFGISGIAASVLGFLADRIGIEGVFALCAYLPLLGIVTVFLPNLRKQR